MEPDINHESEAQVCADSKSNGSETVSGTRQDLSRASGSSRSAPAADAAVPRASRRCAVRSRSLAQRRPASGPERVGPLSMVQASAQSSVSSEGLPRDSRSAEIAWRSASRDVGGVLGHRRGGIDSAAPAGTGRLRGGRRE